MSSDRSRCNPGLQLAAGAMLAACVTGCSGNLRQTVEPDERIRFRAAAVQTLRNAARADDPVLRMNALEALAEVAPAEGGEAIRENIDNGYAGVCFAALMAAGHVRAADLIEQIRTRAEDSDANVVIAALFALHRLGDARRTGELARFLTDHRDPRVRANAAIAIGRLAEAHTAQLLRQALRREKKDAVSFQILEALALVGDRHAIERLIFHGYSALPDQATLALMILANARCHEAEDLFRHRLVRADFPEIKLQAARGLGRLGDPSGLDVALEHLFFNNPRTGRSEDPPAQQISRARQLAALALEAIGSSEALGALARAFRAENQSPYVRVAIARAAISIIDSRRDVPGPLPSAPAPQRRDDLRIVGRQ